MSFFHGVLKAKKKKLWYNTDWTDVAPKLIPDGHQKIPYLGLRGSDMALSGSLNNILSCWMQYWHFNMESRHQLEKNL